MKNSNVHTKALELRRAGYSYSFISEKTSLSKSTLSNWLSNVKYKPNEETVKRIGSARAKSGEVKSQLKQISLKMAYEQAARDIGILNRRDLFMLGIGLYLGEGSKDNSIVRIVNSNPEIISFLIKWFKTICGLKTNNFYIRMHLYPDNNIKESISFWSRNTGLPIKQFQKSYIDIRNDKKRIKYGKLPYGTAHLTVHSGGKKEFGVFLARRIMGWMDISISQSKRV